MVALFSLASLGAFAVVGTLVGWRILKLARASGRVPERCIAVCLLSICGVGYPLLILGRLLPMPFVLFAASLGLAATNLGVGAIYLFTRSVFRPELRWLDRVLWLPISLLVLQWMGVTAELWSTQRSDIAFSVGFWTLLITAVSSVGFGWTGWESLRYWAALRRRVRLGLADPVVANRVALWGTTGITGCLINMTNAWTGYHEINVFQDPFTMIVTGLLGLVTAIALWLAFLPPPAYVKYLRRRLPGRAAASPAAS